MNTLDSLLKDINQQKKKEKTLNQFQQKSQNQDEFPEKNKNQQMIQQQQQSQQQIQPQQNQKNLNKLSQPNEQDILIQNQQDKNSMFIFIKQSKNLSRNRIKIFENNLTKINATCISLQGFQVSHTQQNLNESHNILICGDDVPLNQIQIEFQKYNFYLDQKIQKQIYNCELIVESLKQKQVLGQNQRQQYLLFKDLPQSQENQQEKELSFQKSSNKNSNISNKNDEINNNNELNQQLVKLQLKEEYNAKQQQEKNIKLEKIQNTDKINIYNNPNHNSLKQYQKSFYKQDVQLWDYSYTEEELLNNNNKDNNYQQIFQNNQQYIEISDDSIDYNSEDELNIIKFGLVETNSNNNIFNINNTQQQIQINSQQNKQQQSQQYNQIVIEDDSEEDDQIKVQKFKVLKEEKQEKVEKGENSIFLNQDEDIQFIKQISNQNNKITINDIDTIKQNTIFEGVTQQQTQIIDLESENYQKDIQNQILQKQQIPELKIIKPVLQGLQKKDKYWDSKKDNFQCVQGLDQKKENLNAFITDELEKLQKVYAQDKQEQWRTYAYRKAVTIIKAQNFKITDIKQIENIQGIGDKIRKKIKEIIETGQLQKAKNMTNTEKFQVMEIFQKIWGVGPQSAEILYQKGMKSIKQLRKHQYLLNRNQIIGLKHFEDLQQRMPREEAKLISDKVEIVVKKLENKQNIYEQMTCGSYRRGKDTCGDVDILLCRKDGIPQQDFMKNLIKMLSEGEDKILTDHLQLPHPGSHGSETYMGICLVDKIQRRIDIKLYPREQYGCAVLYFTGSDYFNRSMRLFARKKGWSLSDHGIYRTQRNKNEKVWQGESVACFTEYDVFKVLDIPYKEPSQRCL